MATITLRSVKGLPLTNTELDDNFSNLNSNKAELVSPAFTTPNLGVASGISFNSITGLSSTLPLMNGTAVIGTTSSCARQDHVHPSDTTKASTSQTFYLGTTSVAINRASATLNLTGIGTIAGTSFNSITGLSSTTPIVDGVAAIGSATTAARADHVHPSSAVSGGDAANNIGYLNVPQQSKSAAYTAVLTDSGKHILHPSADTTARVFTIPSNSSVAFPVGTTLTFVNQASAGIVTISITTDIMRLAGAGTTGSRSLAANGIATAIKVTSTEWLISGVNLT